MKSINLKNIILLTIMAAITTAFAIGCKDDDGTLDTSKVKVSNVYDSGCVSPANSEKGGENEETFNVYNDGKTVFVSHNNRVVFCGYDSISVDINVANDTIWVREVENGYVTNCMCEVNTSYQINNLPKGQYTLLIKLCENDYCTPENCGAVKYQTMFNL
ncbi:MAG: hypothetical protein IKJ67_10330 [Bacteroidales bacterium]|nr:hypothetical protein [Bacteroidales bacterium]